MALIRADDYDGLIEYLTPGSRESVPKRLLARCATSGLRQALHSTLQQVSLSAGDTSRVVQDSRNRAVLPSNCVDAAIASAAVLYLSTPGVHVTSALDTLPSRVAQQLATAVFVSSKDVPLAVSRSYVEYFVATVIGASLSRAVAALTAAMSTPDVGGGLARLPKLLPSDWPLCLGAASVPADGQQGRPLRVVPKEHLHAHMRHLAFTSGCEVVLGNRNRLGGAASGDAFYALDFRCIRAGTLKRAASAAGSASAGAGGASDGASGAACDADAGGAGGAGPVSSAPDFTSLRLAEHIGCGCRYRVRVLVPASHRVPCAVVRVVGEHNHDPAADAAAFLSLHPACEAHLHLLVRLSVDSTKLSTDMDKLVRRYADSYAHDMGRAAAGEPLQSKRPALGGGTVLSPDRAGTRGRFGSHRQFRVSEEDSEGEDNGEDEGAAAARPSPAGGASLATAPMPGAALAPAPMPPAPFDPGTAAWLALLTDSERGALPLATARVLAEVRPRLRREDHRGAGDAADIGAYQPRPHHRSCTAAPRGRFGGADGAAQRRPQRAQGCRLQQKCRAAHRRLASSCGAGTARCRPGGQAGSGGRRREGEQAAGSSQHGSEWREGDICPSRRRRLAGRRQHRRCGQRQWRLSSGRACSGSPWPARGKG